MAPAIARHLADLAGKRTRYIEPFIGGGASFAINAPLFGEAYAGDTVPDLVLMWRALADGWQPPDVITEAEYAALRDAEPSPLRGFAGFGGSFGGKWFGGYARGGFNSDGTPRNHQGESARNLSKIGATLAALNVDFRCCDFAAWSPMVNAETVVYCDPPYAGTTGYDAAGAFDSAALWHTADEWATRGALVLVSEYAAPPHWQPIWTGQHRQSLQHGRDGRPPTVERLFIRDAVLAEFPWLERNAA